MLTYTFIAILAGIGTGLTVFLTKNLANYKSPQARAFLGISIGSVTMLPLVIVLSRVPIPQNCFLPFLYLLITGALFSIASVYSIKSLDLIDVSMQTIVSRLNPITIILLSVVLFHEKVTLLMFLGILIILLGVVIATYNPAQLKFTYKGVLYVAISAITAAIGTAFNKLTLGLYSDVVMIAFLNYLLQVPFLISKRNITESKEIILFSPKKIKTVLFLLTIFIPFSWWASIYSIQGNLSTIPLTTQVIQLLTIFLLGTFILKEKSSMQKIIGIILCIIGIILLNFPK